MITITLTITITIMTMITIILYHTVQTARDPGEASHRTLSPP